MLRCGGSKKNVRVKPEGAVFFFTDLLCKGSKEGGNEKYRYSKKRLAGILFFVLGQFIMVFCAPAAEVVNGGEPWRFIVLADWHSAWKYVRFKDDLDRLSNAIAEDMAGIKMLKENFGGELILLPGDSGSGKWFRAGSIRTDGANLTPEQAVLKNGELCYAIMIDVFKNGGYGTLLMAVGDHELGDNPWPPGSIIARCQPQFREAFVKAFNRDPDSGEFLYGASIGAVPSRPLGSRYENTSYAYQYRNALFVTIDAFQFEGPDKRLGDQGAVTGAVTGEHLEWLDRLLGEARKDATIKYIFVQSHLPVIYPVRSHKSSGLFMASGVDGAFWKILRNHKVDVYFAGETHVATVTKDPGSDLVHLVSTGRGFNNFLTVDVFDNKIEITSYNQRGEKPADGEYATSGRLIIYKSGGKTVFEDTGDLAFIDLSKPLYYFDFEKDYALDEHPVLDFLDKGELTKEWFNVDRIEYLRIFPNLGEFGRHHDAFYRGVRLEDGPFGQAGTFNADSRMMTLTRGLLQDDHAVSYALWVKTSSGNDQTLFGFSTPQTTFKQNFFNLHLKSGAPAVVVTADKQLIAKGVKLNDGEWHHVAVSMLRDGCRLSEVKIYVDGELMEAQLTGEDGVLSFGRDIRYLSIGCLGYSPQSFDYFSTGSFIGAMDKISIWARPLTAVEVAYLARRR